MGLGKVLAHHPHIQGRGAPAADLGRIGQHRAFLGQLVEGRGPDIGAVDVAALPGGDDGRRLQVHYLQLGGIDAPVLERRQQAVVGGGAVGHGDALADQILRRREPLLHHQCLGVTELGGEQEHLDGHVLAGRHRQRAGTYVADLHVAGGERPDHAGAAVKLAPVHLGAALFGEAVVGLGHLGGFGRGLVGHGDLDRLGGLHDQRQCRQPEGSSFSCHDVVPDYGDGDAIFPVMTR
ncbi:hypothetical protein D3C84_657570 [compost metagenome]